MLVNQFVERGFVGAGRLLRSDRVVVRGGVHVRPAGSAAASCRGARDVATAHGLGCVDVVETSGSSRRVHYGGTVQCDGCSDISIYAAAVGAIGISAYDR